MRTLGLIAFVSGIAAITSACPANQLTPELDLISPPAAEDVVVALVGGPVVVIPPPVGGTNNNWSFKVDKKPAKSGVGGTLFDADHWPFSPDVEGVYHVCATHQQGAPFPPIVACGSVSAITHLVLSKAPIHVERERAILDAQFAVSVGSNEPIFFLTGPGVTIVNAGTSVKGGDGNTTTSTVSDDEEVHGTLTSDALGNLTCNLVGTQGPTALCPSPLGHVPALGDHIHWKVGVGGAVTNENGHVDVTADVVTASTTGPKLTSLTLSNHGTHFIATIDPPVSDVVTIQLKADDPNFVGGFAQITPDASSTIEGDLKIHGLPADPSTAGTYDVVTRVTSAQGEGIATFAAINVD